jgi:hypothetical protein
MATGARRRRGSVRDALLVVALATGVGATACLDEDELLDLEEEVGSSSHALAPFATLTLQNGWNHAPFGTRSAAVSLDSGIVYFQGAISGGASSVLFTLAPSMRPPAVAYVPVDLCSSTKGRLIIQPSGVVSVQAEGGTFANAQCFTSLEGASFAVSASGFTQLTLQNGWTHAPFSTNTAALRDLGGVVHLRGAIANGTSGVAFTLPGGLVPATNLYVPVDLCNATKGRLVIRQSGVVTVEAEGGAFANARCFTSLEGVSFAVSAFGFAAVALQNGWTHAPYGTSVAAARNREGNVYLKGAVASGTSSGLFTLPSGHRPSTDVYVPIDLCNATKGRLLVQPSGQVSVQANGPFSDARCLTSLDGASFSVPGVCTVDQNVRTNDALIQHGWDLGGYSVNVLGGARDCGGVRTSRDVTVIAGGGRYIVHEAGGPFVPPFQPSNEVTCQPAHNTTVQVPVPCP